MAASDDWRSLESFSFGDSPELADELLALVLEGKKTATCWSIADGQQTEVGKRMVVKDGAGRPRGVLETLSLEQRRFGDVPADFAHAEGEGDRTLECWRDLHKTCFTRQGTYAPDMLLWCERFRLVEVLGEGASR